MKNFLRIVLIITAIAAVAMYWRLESITGYDADMGKYRRRGPLMERIVHQKMPDYADPEKFRNDMFIKEQSQRVYAKEPIKAFTKVKPESIGLTLWINNYREMCSIGGKSDGGAMKLENVVDHFCYHDIDKATLVPRSHIHGYLRDHFTHIYVGPDVLKEKLNYLLKKFKSITKGYKIKSIYESQNNKGEIIEITKEGDLLVSIIEQPHPDQKDQKIVTQKELKENFLIVETDDKSYYRYNNPPMLFIKEPSEEKSDKVILKRVKNVILTTAVSVITNEYMAEFTEDPNFVNILIANFPDKYFVLYMQAVCKRADEKPEEEEKILVKGLEQLISDIKVRVELKKIHALRFNVRLNEIMVSKSRTDEASKYYTNALNLLNQKVRSTYNPIDSIVTHYPQHWMESYAKYLDSIGNKDEAEKVRDNRKRLKKL